MTVEQPKFYTDQVRVNTYECDFLGRWKPAAFFQHMTEAASQHSTVLGFGLDVLASYNIYWVLSRMKLAVYDYPRQSELIRVRTWPKTYQQKLFYVRDFQFINDQDQIIAAATSAWLIINGTTRHLVPPHKLEQLQLPNSTDVHGLDEPLEKLSLPEDAEECYRQKVRFSDVDEVGHMNNTRYVERICDAFDLDYYRAHQIAWMQVNYDKEVRYGEELAIYKKQTEGQDELFGLRGVNLSSDTRAFEAVVQFGPLQE